jgi:hypothetical protein
MVDRRYRLCCGPGDLRPARGQGYGVWAIDLGDPRTTMRKLQGYDCVQFTALVFGKSSASQARVKLQFTSLSKC